jgi:uncharacterized heparinase superfamily protein
MTLGRTLRTVRYLRPRQIAWRLRSRALRPWFGSALYDHLFLASRGVGGIDDFPPTPWPADAENGRRMLEGTIRLIGRDHPFAVPVDWKTAEQPMLWRFTLHYFEWLADLESIGDNRMARAAIDDWMEAHPRPDAVAWHPYPLSLRIFAWLRHARFLLDGAGDSFKRRFIAALERQTRHLARVVERDVGGNHIIKNLKALIAAGRVVEGLSHLGPPALIELEREVARQVLPDGGHYERSPAYHLQVLCDLLDVRAVLGGSAPKWLEDAVSRMAGALVLFRHGDGGLALFNDGDVGRPPLLRAVAEHLGGLPEPPDALADCGYYRLGAAGALVLMDAGRCCPDDLPAHAHADALSFEFSAGPERIVVNSGTFAYQDDAWRNRLRGTAAHSTVEIDGDDSAEVYATFRVGRRPRAVSAIRGDDEAAIRVSGSHDGYRHLGLNHRRRLTLERDGRSLAGEDRIERTGAEDSSRHTVTARFHLHPSVSATPDGPRTVRLRTAGGMEWVFSVAGGTPRLEGGVYAPGFYEMHPTRQIVVERILDGGSTRLAWCFDRRDG